MREAYRIFFLSYALECAKRIVFFLSYPLSCPEEKPTWVPVFFVSCSPPAGWNFPHKKVPPACRFRANKRGPRGREKRQQACVPLALCSSLFRRRLRHLGCRLRPNARPLQLRMPPLPALARTQRRRKTGINPPSSSIHLLSHPPHHLRMPPCPALENTKAAASFTPNPIDFSHSHGSAAAAKDVCHEGTRAQEDAARNDDRPPPQSGDAGVGARWVGRARPTPRR